MTPFKVAFYVGLFVAMPVVIYQIWAFVAPGLYRREKRFAVPLLVSSVILFYAGAVFAYFAVFPVMFSYLVGTAPAGVSYMPDMASYLDFVLTLFFAFGVAFEMPVAVVLLVLTGLVNVDTLGKNRGYVIIGIFVVAAFLTPAGRDLANHHGRAHVPALRGRARDGTPHAEDAPRSRRGRRERRSQGELKRTLARRAAGTVKRPAATQPRLAGAGTHESDSAPSRRSSAYKNSGQK